MTIEFMEEPEIQAKNKQNPVDRIQPYQWKKGQSGNIMGRPKGKTMKEYAREYLARMNEEERDAFMEGIAKESIWKMAEGNPHSTGDQNVHVVMPEKQDKEMAQAALGSFLNKKHGNTTDTGEQRPEED